MLSPTTVDMIVGQPVIGRSSFVIGAPDPTINRISYINCRFGITAAVGQPEDPQVEVGVSAYASVASAAARVTGTVDGCRGSGGASASVAVQTGVTGTVLTGCGTTTLVAANGNRTVAVSVLEPLLGAKRDAVLTGLAAKAFNATGG